MEKTISFDERARRLGEYVRSIADDTPPEEFVDFIGHEPTECVMIHPYWDMAPFQAALPNITPLEHAAPLIATAPALRIRCHSLGSEFFVLSAISNHVFTSGTHKHGS